MKHAYGKPVKKKKKKKAKAKVKKKSKYQYFDTFANKVKISINKQENLCQKNIRLAIQVLR